MSEPFQAAVRIGPVGLNGPDSAPGEFLFVGGKALPNALVCEGEDLGGEDGGVARIVDADAGDGHTGGHLDDGVEGV
jgi:hypothetical protein